MKKLRFYFDKNKEEKWLNQMAENGWAMKGFFLGIYTFESCEPGEYIYAIDMPGEIGKNGIGIEEKREYIEFVEETGAEYVCTWGWWVIFRKKISEGAFELYTDPESQIALYKRIRKLFFWVVCLEVFIGVMNTTKCLIYGTKNGTTVELAGLALIYAFIVVFIVGIIKTTLKIKKIEKNVS